ncbi:rhomboid family intramembrane serine protease [Estrella lausannensis]|uniref:Rhomboid family protein n=1 Tax=Estrella lausannensis TaxID=483423 RepID=A0A0H5DRU5_9BACT|nr:rhomboid family intramembrane serine protease [Estrella lausannensis]CRX39342.1 Rhomboid family protein [Estrella lausannensis]
MNRDYQHPGPADTPLVIKRLILITALSALFSSLAEVFVNAVFALPGPQTFLALNTSYLFQGFLFQLVTYPLTYGTPGEGVTFFYMITLAIHLYVMWIMGTNIVERMGTRAFVKLYLYSTLLGGIGGAAFAYLNHTSAILTGCTPQVLAILVAWTALNGEGRLFLMFPLSIKAKWLTLIVLLFTLIPPLSALDFPLFAFNACGAMTGWLFALTSWHLKSPWRLIKSAEDNLLIFLARAKLYFRKKSGSKIIDIRSFREDTDEEFMDDMLEKISKFGEGSLTARERKRMQRISRQKNQPR